MRRFTPLLAAAALALVVAGCGSSNTRQTTTPTTPPGTDARSTSSAPATTTTAKADTTTATSAPPPTTASTSAGSGSAGSAPESRSRCVPQGRAAGARDGDPALDAVQFVSAKQGWVAGAGWIVTTGDGGRTWSTQLQTDQRFSQVDFVSATTGWAVGGRELLGTTDGGRCWVDLGDPNPPLASVHFVSPTTGWGVAARTTRGFAATPVPGGGTLVRTTDGGRSWTPVDGAPANAQSVCFVDGSNGWLGADGRIFATHDGGSSWQQVADPSRVPGRTTGADLETVQCAAPSGVWVVSDTDNGAAGTVPWATFASTDGRHFREVDQAMYGGPSGVPPAPGSYPGVTSVIDRQTAAIVAFTPASEPQSAAMAMATGGGAQVSPTRLLPAMRDATGAAFVSPTTGWVVGDAVPSGSGRQASTGLVAATSDGGRSWRIVFRIQ